MKINSNFLKISSRSNSSSLPKIFESLSSQFRHFSSSSSSSAKRSSSSSQPCTSHFKKTFDVYNFSITSNLFDSSKQGRWKVGAEAPLHFFQLPIEVLSPPSAPPFKNLYLQYTLLHFNDGLWRHLLFVFFSSL